MQKVEQHFHYKHKVIEVSQYLCTVKFYHQCGEQFILLILFSYSNFTFSDKEILLHVIASMMTINPAIGLVGSFSLISGKGKSLVGGSPIPAVLTTGSSLATVEKYRIISLEVLHINF